VALQATGALPLVASAAAASCCCHHDKSRACRCPVCTHARELASRQRFLRTCAAHGDGAVIAVQGSPAVAPPQVVLPAPAAKVLPIVQPPSAAPTPDREIPTPPPLG